jgi:hypothetical protein
VLADPRSPPTHQQNNRRTERRDDERWDNNHHSDGRQQDQGGQRERGDREGEDSRADGEICHLAGKLETWMCLSFGHQSSLHQLCHQWFR